MSSGYEKFDFRQQLVWKYFKKNFYKLSEKITFAYLTNIA